MYARNSGILIAYSLGSYYTYIQSSFYFIGSTLIFLMAIWFVPSTPQYFLKKDRIEMAQKSFNFYNKHRLQSDPKFCMVQFESLKDCVNVTTNNAKITWSDIGEYFLLFNTMSASIKSAPYADIALKHGIFLNPSKFLKIFLHYSEVAAGIFPGDYVSNAERIDGTDHLFNIWIDNYRKIGHTLTDQYRFHFHGCGAIARYVYHI